MCGAEAEREGSAARQMRAFGLAGAIATGVLLAAVAGPVRAIEFEPNEIVPAPPGTNAALGYLYFNHLGEITAASPGRPQRRQDRVAEDPRDGVALLHTELPAYRGGAA